MRNSHARQTDFLVGSIEMLVTEKTKNLVFLDRSPERATRAVAVQFRQLLTGRNVGVGVKKEWDGVQGIGSTMCVGAPMKIIGTRSGAHVNVRPTRGSLLR